MKKISIAVCFALCGALAFSASACGFGKTEEKFQTTLNVALQPDGAREEINPLIYGQFIEHIEDCIYDGIWAEKVLDRKFYYAAGTAGLSPWKTKGNVASQTAVTLSGGHAAEISADGAIYQSKIAVQKKDYEGYFWCDTDTGCTVRITLSSGLESAETTVTVPVNNSFTKFDYSLACGVNTSNATYELKVVSGAGKFDSLSLMPADNYRGMRTDTLEALKELNGTIYRWPGGNFLSGYDWLDGVGEIDKRPSRRNLHYMGLESSFISEEAMIASDIVKLQSLGFYGGIEPNDFGLDEFLAMCEYVGAEPMMMVNNGLGSLEDAAAQVEYCNGAANTVYGKMRAQNGHKEPYSITYWGVGNEMFGSWQLGQVPIREYVLRHNRFAKAMKAKDGSIVLIASGNNASNWSDELFRNCGGNFDFIAEHMYAKQDNADVFTHLNNMRTNINFRIDNHRALLEKYPAQGNVKIAFTEYAYDLVTNPSRLKDGMGIAVFLNAVINNADVFETCCYSSTVNATQGCVKTWAGSAVLEGAGYVLKTYREKMQRYRIPSGIKFDRDLQLDLSAAVSEDGKTLSLAVVNPSDSAVRLSNPLFDRASEIVRNTFTGDYYDSYNTPQQTEMYCERVQSLSNVVAPPMSVNVFEIKLK